MQVKATNKYDKTKVRTHDLEALVESKVQERLADGQIEALNGKIRNLTELLAKVIESLDPSDEQLNEWLADYDEELSKVKESNSPA